MKPTYIPEVEASSALLEWTPDTSKQNDGADSETEETRRKRQVMLNMKNRMIMKNVKDELEAQYKKDDINMEIGNRMSWPTVVRLSQSFETREEAVLQANTKGINERRHGITTENLGIDKRGTATMVT